MRKWAQEKTYYQRTKEFSEMNNLFLMCWFLAVVAVLILKTEFEKWNGESDFVNYVKNNQADRHQWYRAFIAECLSSNNVNFYSYLQKCQKILLQNNIRMISKRSLRNLRIHMIRKKRSSKKD